VCTGCTERHAFPEPHWIAEGEEARWKSHSMVRGREASNRISKGKTMVIWTDKFFTVVVAALGPGERRWLRGLDP
jgi:hypothetical protein